MDVILKHNSGWPSEWSNKNKQSEDFKRVRLKCYFCYSFLECVGIFFLKKAYFISIIFKYYIFKVCLHIGYKEEKTGYLSESRGN